jgi:hypothetical protein
MPAAQETGFEGVACVDDAARAVVLYCALWRRQPQPAIRVAALGLLEFLAYMQDGIGRFNNFILDWEGRKNSAGSTSYSGGPQWQARALHAIACGLATFGGAEWDARFRQGLEWIDDAMPYLDVRAVGALAALEHWRATGTPSSGERALAWCVEIAGQAGADQRLPNAHGGDESIHLWGHLQELALAEIGSAFGRADLVAAARASAEALLLPGVDWCETADHVLPFDVSCVIAGLAGVARATGERRYADGADRARAWFSGRNAAGQPVYDSTLGVVFDGIDEQRVSRNSGAESNIEGALALLALNRSDGKMPIPERRPH